MTPSSILSAAIGSPCQTYELASKPVEISSRDQRMAEHWLRRRQRGFRDLDEMLELLLDDSVIIKQAMPQAWRLGRKKRRFRYDHPQNRRRRAKPLLKTPHAS